MNGLKNSPLVLSILLITFLAMLAYLLLTPLLGFYSDDFFFGYVSHFLGFEGIMKSLIIDRPFNGYLLAIHYSFLGDNVFLWHLYAFFIKLAGGLILFFTLLIIFPKKIQIMTLISVLFLLYPGYQRQTLALGFVNWIFTLDLWLISLFFTTLAIKSSAKFKIILFTFLSLLFQINSYLQLEFFIGMETLRILLIIYLLSDKKSRFDFSIKTFNKILSLWKYWSPYLISTIIFVLWRLLIFKSTRQETDISWVAQTYYSNPYWILKLPLEIINSFFQAVLFAFIIPIAINTIRLPIMYSVISLSGGLTASLFLSRYLNRFKISKADKKTGKVLLMIGTISVISALIPIIISGRFVRMYYVFDRYTITSIIGISFILVGLLLKFGQTRVKFVLILLVTIAVTSNLMNGFWFKITWDRQKDLWWQLYWRTPAIQNSSMLILDFTPATEGISPFIDIYNKVKWYRFYWVEEQIWTAGNLFFNYSYPPQSNFYGDFLEDDSVAEKIKTGVVELVENRSVLYTRDFSKSVIIKTPGETSCLWVLDKDRVEFPENSNRLIKSNISYSDPENLVKKGGISVPPSQIFGNEPAKDWCYYYQKASLYRQLADWDNLSNTSKEVFEKNLKPNDYNEWLPFIEGLIVSGDYSNAEELINGGINSEIFKKNICNMVNRLQTTKVKIYCEPL